MKTILDVPLQDMDIVQRTGYSVLAFKVKTADLSDFSLSDDISIENLRLSLYTQKKRSMNAHNYFWSLIGKLAQKLEIPKDEIYRELIRRVGIFTDQNIEKDNVEAISRAWESQGIGWIADEILFYEDIVTVRFYKGISSYDSYEMRILLNHLVEECKEQGIKTLEDYEIEQLARKWAR